jgi:hypothetical protein
MKPILSLLTVAAAFLSLQGCSIYSPMISQRVDPKELDKLDLRECTSEPVDSMALRRACLKLRDIERARMTHQGLISATGNVLIPAATYTTYRVARDLSSAATTGWALTGLAGYATVGYLAPDGRVEAYTRGAQAISCGLGIYGVATASAPRAVFERATYEAALEKAKSDIRAQEDTAKKAGGSIDLSEEKQTIRNIESAVRAASTTALLDAQLERFVNSTVDELNKLLRGTLPTLANLSSDVANLSNVVTQLSAADVRSADLEPLRVAANALIKAEAERQRATADFSSCNLSTAALTAQGLYKPMALGPGNTMDGKTVTLEKDKALVVPIIGGMTPLGFNVTGPHEASRPDVQLTMQGTVLLTVTMKAQDTAADQTHTVAIYDSAGASRTIKVVVPKASK